MGTIYAVAKTRQCVYR